MKLVVGVGGKESRKWQAFVMSTVDHIGAPNDDSTRVNEIYSPRDGPVMEHIRV